MSEVLKVISPFDHHLIREYPLADESSLEEALGRARKAFVDPGRHLAKFQRIGILEKLAAMMEGRVEELTLMAAEEGGKPYQDSRVEVLRAINGVRLAVSSLYGLKGEEVPMGLTAPSINRLAFTFREPIGVVLAISAFNHPLNLIVHQVIPAVAAGCPVIVKPASSTPVSCFNLVDMLREAGLPGDLCIPVVTGRQQAEKLARDERLGFLSFIGSHEVGWRLRSLLAPGTRVALEHGGVAPVIIDRTADLDILVKDILKGGFYHAGQVCVSVQRVFVHEEVADEVASRLVAGAITLKTGDPLDPSTDVGPLIQPGEVVRVNEWVKQAAMSGGRVLTGGEPLSDTVYPPTIIMDPPDDAMVSKEEVFGPVICLYPFRDISLAVERANALRYAFQAAVYTRDIDMAMQLASRINASAVMINDHTAFRVDWMPFGGRDASGIGTGGIAHTMAEMTREKLVVIKSRGLP